MKKLLFTSLLLMLPLRLHATWDVTTPAGTEAKSQGDNRIREFKTDVQTALRHEGVFPGPDTANPRYWYAPSTGTSSQRPIGNDRTTGQLYINVSSHTVERYNGTTWDPIASLLPSGSELVFFQASCPSGWTQDTTVNAQALRTVSGTGGGTGGSTDISTVTFSHSHTVNSHTHSISSDGSHTHTTPAHTHELDYTTYQTINPHSDSGNSIINNNADGDDSFINIDSPIPSSGVSTTVRHYKTGTSSGGSGTTGSSGSHNHTGATGSASPGTDTQLANIALGYANVIICKAP